MGIVPVNGRPFKLNGAIFIMCGILKCVVASAAEAEIAALFINAKEGKIIRMTLEEMGHKQPPTPMHCDNITATGIANDTVKKQRSRSMEMRFFWITDQVKICNFDVQWHPGQENRADYYTKHFDVDTTVSLLGGVYHQSVLYSNWPGFPDPDAIVRQNCLF